MMIQTSNNENEKNKNGMRVAASPFNGAKLELFLLCCIGGVLWLLLPKITSVNYIQLLILLAYGVFLLAWVVIRVALIANKEAKHES